LAFIQITIREKISDDGNNSAEEEEESIEGIQDRDFVTRI
jgi:hypothetical protein